jgi:hypothetical protein
MTYNDIRARVFVKEQQQQQQNLSVRARVVYRAFGLSLCLLCLLLKRETKGK